MWHGARMFAASAVFPSGRILFWRDEFSGLKELCEDTAVEKVFHNSKFDIRMLEWAGIIVKGKIHDTMGIGHLIDASQRAQSLDKMATRYLSPARQKIVVEIDTWFKDHKISNKQRYFNDLPPELLKRRCIGDSTATLLLMDKLYPYIKKNHLSLYEREMDLVWVIKDMEDRGVCVDMEELKRQQDFLSDVIDDAILTCEGILGRELNPNSYNDKVAMLAQADMLRLITKRTKTGKYQLTKDILQALPQHPVPQLLLRIAMATKLTGTFLAQVERFQVDGVLHASFNQFGTVTGRLSSSKPNLQNIPTEGGHLSTTEIAKDLEDNPLAPHIKRVFVCRPGYVHQHCDKKQIEVRMLLHYAKDPVGKAIIESGRHIHTEMCREIFGEVNEGLKVRAKSVVFGWAYGMGATTLSEELLCSKTQARSYFRMFEKAFPNVAKQKRVWMGHLSERGYVETIHGRKYRIPEHKDYVCTNYVCQGTAADELKDNMVDMDKNILVHYPDVHMLLQIHDELVFEIPYNQVEEVAPKIQAEMDTSRVEYFIPMTSSSEFTKTRWSELQDMDIVNGKVVNIKELMKC